MGLEDDYDREASDLHRKWVGRVERFLIGMGCDHGLAEEITNDAFLSARRHWHHVRTLDAPEGYVFKIARRERGKRQKVYDKSAKDLCPDPSGPLPNLDDGFTQKIADREMVRQALQTLAPRVREAVILRDVLDLSEATTAEVMAISISAVKRYTHDGRTALRRLLAEFRPRREGKGQ
jgi:RNA polymerase sigma-70 factor (ECF subfamily)